MEKELLQLKEKIEDGLEKNGTLQSLARVTVCALSSEEERLREKDLKNVLTVMEGIAGETGLEITCMGSIANDVLKKMPKNHS